MIKNAYETSAKPTFAALIYGQTGVGKSTLACSASNAAVIDFDGGIERVAIQHRKPYALVESWQDALQDTQQLIQAGVKTIVVDTVGRMIDCIELDIKANNPAMIDRTGGLTLKGFGKRKIMFSDYLKTLKAAGVNVVFVAQETETEEDGRKIRRPAVGSDKMATELLQDIDIAGYAHIVNGKRVVEFGCVDYAWTKNSCRLPKTVTLPDLDKGADNNMVDAIAEQFRQWQDEKVLSSEAYQNVCHDIDGICGKVSDCESLNVAVEEVQQLPVVLTSKLYARQAILNAAKRLSCVYDAAAKKYIAKKKEE